MKKLLAFTLALLLVVLLLPTTALAEENEYVIENTTQNIKYTTVCSALRDAKDGDTLVLLQNCEAKDDNFKDILSVVVGKGYRDLGYLTLDLAGYTLEIKNGILTQGYSVFTIINSTPNTGGIKVTAPMGDSAFFTNSRSKTIIDGVKITGETGAKLIGYSSGASCEIKNCNITWKGDCIYIDSYSILLQNTEMELTEGEKSAIDYRGGGSITIDNCKITGAGANLLIRIGNENDPVMGISIASDDRQNGFMALEEEFDQSAGCFTFGNGVVSLPGVENAGEKLKGMMNAQIYKDALLVTGPDGLYIGDAAWECLDDVKSGETYTIEQAGTPDQMAELAKARAVPANGCTIVNGTNEDITVNEVVIQPGQSHTFTEKGPELDPELDPPSTIVIIRPTEEEATQPNPATGAPQVIAVAAAASAIAAVLAAVLLLRRKEE